MRIAFLVNTVDELTLDMSTVLLMNRAAQQGHDVRVCGVEDLSLSPEGRVLAASQRVAQGPLEDGWLSRIKSEQRSSTGLRHVNLVFIRTNPARDPGRARAHAAALAMAQLLEQQGPRVLNAPDGLLRASSKLYLTYFPAHLRPETLVSSSRPTLKAFVDERGGVAVLKPLAGTHGQRVFRVGPQEGNLSAILDAVLLDGPAIAQELVPKAEEGDVRLLLVNGRPLEVGGQIAAVRRVPGAGEFRSNIHAGGRAIPAKVDADLLRIAEEVGPRLRQDGIFFAGLDVIGGKVIEINAYSPGGLGDASEFCGVDFTEAVIDAALRDVAALA